MTYRINGELVSKEEFQKRARKGTPIEPGDRLTVFTDGFSSFVSPVNGEFISSKAQLREHEKRNNVVQVGDAFDSKVNAMRAKRKEKENGEPSN